MAEEHKYICKLCGNDQKDIFKTDVYFCGECNSMHHVCHTCMLKLVSDALAKSCQQQEKVI